MDLLKAIENIKQSTLYLNDFKSLNELSPLFYCQHKLVIKDNGKIYRIDNSQDVKERLLTREWFLHLGFDIFLEEVLIEDLCFGNIWVTEQEPVQLLSFNEATEKFSLLPQKIKEIFNEHSFIWFLEKNCGVKNNQLTIFDWIANLAVRQNCLVSAKGEVLYERAFLVGDKR